MQGEPRWRPGGGRFRSWKLTNDDVVEDDVEDRYIARRRVDVDVEESEAAERERAVEEDRA